ncbi:WGR domain-containing protein [Aquimarina muelleri]|uniref:WGR domain-containing protein n=1 Tax=Aquimarina muelleri TaxID=279356 RepID=A0A918JW25_9FLAO|nr:WGR domain-containing protein [Aquimarina muelleri]MCX2763227.1 WGR domain-containing protein [Aquimarina muelleri]GGX20076.1 hypothetical protein GCM10007384_21850 [Aquimarina muelleri]
MKLLKSKSLYFKDAKSDKIYEVDLCEVDSELFVVNFRYGRQGSTLREGTKTVFPVSYEEAATTFDKLVKSKENKGYAEEDQENALIQKTEINEDDNVNTARNEVILKYLKDAVLGNYTRDWKVSRIIWRAGALGLVESSEHISHFITSKDEFEQYSAILVLAKFKDTTVIERIFHVFDEKKCTNKVGRAAAAYLLKTSNEGNLYQKEIFEYAKKELPIEIVDHLNNKQELLSELAAYFMKESGMHPLCIYYLYLLSYQDTQLRDILYTFINRLPLKLNTFKSIRYIYRTAEVTEDFVFYALISKRIAISKPGYRGYGTYDSDWNWISADEEKKKNNPRIAFSRKTKEYFGNATYKTIHSLGKFNVNGYVDFAKELLCSLDDATDKRSEETKYQYNYDYDTGNYETIKQQYPKYCDFPALMYVLYGNAERFHRTRKRWYYVGDVSGTTQLPREEALQEVWNTKPQEVLYILANAKSEEAIRFSIRIIEDQPSFLDEIPPDIFRKLIIHYDARVVNIVIDILEKKYETEKPEEEILLSLLLSNSKKAQTLGLEWLQKYEVDYMKSADFLAALIVIERSEVTAYVYKLYENKVAYDLPLHIDQLAPFLETSNTYPFDFLLKINELIGKTYFGQLLKDVSKEKIKELVNSSSIANKLFAATLSRVNTIPTYELSKDYVGEYLNADEEVLRKAGIELVSDFPDQYLLEHHQLISGYCFSPHIEVREAIQPTIGKLTGLDKKFKQGLLDKLLQVLTEEESYEGVHKSSYEVLTKYYGNDLQEVNQDGILALILSKYEFAQKLGTPIFQKRIQLHDLTISQLISLSTSDVRVIRDTLEVYFKSNPSRINYEFEEALRIFNTDWKDAREWAFDFFDNTIKTETWTLDTLLYICDHTKQDVQAFGRKMVTTRFRKEEGLQLLLKLQEHPSKTMQFFTTNYLDTYARDAPEVILKLEAFFKTTLFNINTNSAAKARVYGFLEKEGVKDPLVANMVIRVLDSVLATKTIKDKSKCIDIMLAIKETFPEIEIPLIIKAV